MLEMQFKWLLRRAYTQSRKIHDATILLWLCSRDGDARRSLHMPQQAPSTAPYKCLRALKSAEPVVGYADSDVAGSRLYFSLPARRPFL
jgi:hypothetical protein